MAFLSLALALLTSACEDYPRDPEGTLERVSGGTLRAGAIAAEPWVKLGEEGPSGVEVELVEQLARSLDAEISWYSGSEHDVIDALEHRRLDIAVGGLTKNSPRRSAVAFTRPYAETSIVVAAPSAAAVADLDGQHVVVEPGTIEAAYVEAAGGVPVQEAAGEAPRLLARRSWQVDASEAIVRHLRTQEHVVAVPHGENAWLITVDRFLRGKADAARQRLRALDR